MHARRFDAFVKLFADRRAARRQATPVVSEEHSIAKTMFLFVQSFRSGSVAPKEGEDGRYTLTLEQGLGQTIYFANRPAREVGTVPTPEFLEGLGFDPDNPPNAALVISDGAGTTDWSADRETTCW